MHGKTREDDTISLLYDEALFCEREKDFLGCGFWDGTLQVGRNIYCSEWAIHLSGEWVVSKARHPLW